jgi:hypothetical protein
VELVNSSKKVSCKIPEMRSNQWHERKQKKGIPRPESKKSSRWSQRGRSGGVAEDDLPRAHQMAVSHTYMSRKPREGRRANLIKEDLDKKCGGRDLDEIHVLSAEQSSRPSPHAERQGFPLNNTARLDSMATRIVPRHGEENRFSTSR